MPFDLTPPALRGLPRAQPLTINCFTPDHPIPTLTPGGTAKPPCPQGPFSFYTWRRQGGAGSGAEGGQAVAKGLVWGHTGSRAERGSGWGVIQGAEQSRERAGGGYRVSHREQSRRG